MSIHSNNRPHLFQPMTIKSVIVFLAREFLREPDWPRLEARALGHKDAVSGPVKYGRAW
jgi:hypothetical protein